MLLRESWKKTKHINDRIGIKLSRQYGFRNTPHVYFKPCRFPVQFRKHLHRDREWYMSQSSIYAFRRYVKVARLATASILLIYATTFLANKNTESRNVFEGNVSHLPGIERKDYEVTHQFRQSNSMVSSSGRLQDIFSDRMLSYCVKDWPPDFSSIKSYTPYVGYIFLHENLISLAFGSYFTWVLAPPLMVHFGITKILFTFVASGFTASQLHSAIDKSYALRSNFPLFKYIKATPSDPNPIQTLSTPIQGSHSSNSALFALAICNSSRGGSRMGFFRSPPGLLAICIIGLDAWAYYENYLTPYPGGYLAGFISGGLVYFGWLRWTKVPRMLRPPR